MNHSYTELYNALRFYSAIISFLMVVGCGIVMLVAHLMDKADERKRK